MNKAKAVLDILAMLELSREELQTVVREIVRTENLTIADCFPDYSEKNNLAEISANCLAISAELVKRLEQLKPASPAISALEEKTDSAPVEKKRRGRKPKIMEKAEAPTEEACPEKTLPVAPPKRRGRPRKNPLPVAEAPVPPIPAEPSSEAEISDDTAEKQPFSETELDPEEIKPLQMGKTLAFSLLYKLPGKRYVRSSRVMTEGELMGLLVPYCFKGRYKNFVLGLMDEVSGITISAARAYAKNQIAPYGGNDWGVLTESQIRSCKAVRVELNKQLRKLGGDIFTGHYITDVSPVYKQGDVPDKIRYAVPGDLA